MTCKPFIHDLDRDFIQNTLDEIRSPVEIAVYGLENGFNIGGIVRTAHSFLVGKIHFIEVDWFYEKAALSTLRWEKKNIKRWDSTEHFISGTSNQNIVAFEKRPSIDSLEDIRYFSYPQNPILVFGSEKFGIPDLLLNRADHIVSIPMLGLSNDFNVSVAAGMALYDWYNKHTTNSTTVNNT